MEACFTDKTSAVEGSNSSVSSHLVKAPTCLCTEVFCVSAPRMKLAYGLHGQRLPQLLHAYASQQHSHSCAPLADDFLGLHTEQLSFSIVTGPHA